VGRSLIFTLSRVDIDIGLECCRCSDAEISSAIVTSQKKTPAAAAAAAAACNEKLVQFTVSRYGALIAVYNTCDSTRTVFKMADVNDGPADSWNIVVEHEVRYIVHQH